MLCYVIFVVAVLFISVQLVNTSTEDKTNQPTVIKLTDETFGPSVSEGKTPWLVLVYSGNSTFATTSVENFKIAANLLKLVYRFGYLDLIKNPITATIFKMVTYDDAALFIFGDDRTNPIIELQAGLSWEVSHFVKEGVQGLHNLISWRLENFDVDAKSKRKPQEFTPERFQSQTSSLEVNGTYSPWLVLFYNKEDAEYDNVKKTYEIAAAELYPKVQTAAINVGKYYNFTSTFFDVLFTPTIMYVGKRSVSNTYTAPILPMAQMPTVAYICNFGLSERLMDLSASQNNGISAVMIAFEDVPYNNARLFYFNGNTTIHIFTRL